MAITLPNTQIPQTQGLPSLGDSAKWLTMGAGTAGDLMYQLERSMLERNAGQEDIMRRDIGLRDSLDPMLTSEMDLQRNLNQYLNTPENVGILAGGELGTALKRDAEGRLEQGLVPSKIGEANLKYEGLSQIRDLQNKYDAVNNAYILGNTVKGNTLHPMLPKWKEAIGKVVETFGFAPGSPEYEQAINEWAIPSDVTLETFDKVARNLALRRDDHMRAVNLAEIKGQYGVREAEARTPKTTDDKEKVATIKALSADLSRLRDSYTKTLLKRNEARLQLRPVLSNINDPEEKAAAETDYLKDYDDVLRNLKREIKATKSIFMKEDPENPMLYEDDEEGGAVIPPPGRPGTPVGKVTPVEASPSSNAPEVVGGGRYDQGKIRRGEDWYGKAQGEPPPKKTYTKQERLDIMFRERERILADGHLSNEEKRTRLQTIDRDIKATAAGKS